MASVRKKANKIKELRREDGSIVEEKDLTNYVCAYFQELFTSTAGTHVDELTAKLQPSVTVALLILRVA